METEQEQKVNQSQGGVGPVIASIIIVVILLIGGYYSLKSSNSLLPQASDIDGGVVQQPSPVIAKPAMPPQESTEITDIEADAMAVDTTPIDTGLDNLDLLVK